MLVLYVTICQIITYELLDSEMFLIRIYDPENEDKKVDDLNENW